MLPRGLLDPRASSEVALTVEIVEAEGLGGERGSIRPGGRPTASGGSDRSRVPSDLPHRGLPRG